MRTFLHLATNQTEHGFKLTAGLEYPADCAQHEQPQTFIGELAFLCSKKMGQGRSGCARCRPIPDHSDSHGWMVLVAVGDNGDCFLDFLFAGQRVLIFQI